MSQLASLLKCQRDQTGTVSLFDHLNELLFKMTQSNLSYAKELESFEVLSDFFKKNRFQIQNPKTDVELRQPENEKKEFAEWAQKVSQLIQQTNPRTMPTILQNFVNDARALELAGVGFGEDFSFHIQLSIKKLAQETQAKELQFWGKILGREKDYFVAMGVTPPMPTDVLPQNAEPRGVGVNYYTFWVTHDILTDWIELPLITPEQINAARTAKYVCTGNLNAVLKSYPPFPGKEKHYLKSQLVRITHSNKIAPKGLYKTNDENAKEIEFEEEFKLPEFADFANLENWVHVPPQILKLGRITPWVDPTLSEDQKQAKLDELNEQDPEIERLKGINEDRPLEPFETNWLVKTQGDMQQFNPLKEDGSMGVYGVTILKNYTWPGSLTVAYRTGFVNLYVGYGFKLTQAPFIPFSPNDILEEPEEIEENYEPNPKNLPPPPKAEENAEEQQNQEAAEDQ